VSLARLFSACGLALLGGALAFSLHFLTARYPRLEAPILFALIAALTLRIVAQLGLTQ
jgi:hypothetical protein